MRKSNLSVGFWMRSQQAYLPKQIHYAEQADTGAFVTDLLDLSPLNAHGLWFDGCTC